jgi:hypothetical protein
VVVWGVLSGFVVSMPVATGGGFFVFLLEVVFSLFTTRSPPAPISVCNHM